MKSKPFAIEFRWRPREQSPTWMNDQFGGWRIFSRHYTADDRDQALAAFLKSRPECEARAKDLPEQQPLPLAAA